MEEHIVLAHPVYADHHHTDDITEPLGPHMNYLINQLSVIFYRRYMQLQHKQSNRNGEDPVAESQNACVIRHAARRSLGYIASGSTTEYHCVFRSYAAMSSKSVIQRRWFLLVH